MLYTVKEPEHFTSYGQYVNELLWDFYRLVQSFHREVKPQKGEKSHDAQLEYNTRVFKVLVSMGSAKSVHMRDIKKVDAMVTRSLTRDQEREFWNMHKQLMELKMDGLYI